MSAEPTNVEKLRGLPWGIAFSAANSIFVQFSFFGSVFVLFLSELGLSKTEMGSLLSLLPFSGLIALFIAPTIARIGYKRTFLGFWGIRSIVTAFLLLTPWVLSHLGRQTALVFVATIVTGFAISRSVGMTARLPWVQECIPNSVRGKYSAMSNIFSRLTGFLAVMAAGYVIEHSTGLSGFTVLFAAGVLVGLLSVWLASFIPGGAPVRGLETEGPSHRGLVEAARDRNFQLYLVGVGLIILISGPVASFLPLFMQEQVGLSTSNVVWLQNGTLLGGLLASYFWGWLADRYGGKPVMMSGVLFQIALPACWLLMPRQATWSFHAALGIALMQGIASMGWFIGSTRLRFVCVVPPEKSTSYMALFFAWIGIVEGVGQLVGGRVLDASSGISGKFLVFTLDPFTGLFLAALALPIVASLLFRRVRADTTVGMGEFAAMFFRGNPFTAMESLIGYHRAKDERATVSMTERLGRTESPLTVDELLEALSDPRFYVRYEAIVSIARRGPDARLTDALMAVLAGNEPALSTVSAWALGRIGDERAIQALREGLGADYRSVQAHCARSLGTLEDMESAPTLLERLEAETDPGLRMAYASALGQLRAREATGKLLTLLHTIPDEDSRNELALALARIVGDEHHFIQLLRHARAETGTTTSQAVTSLKKLVSEFQMDSSKLLTAMDDCADALAREELERGVALMGRVIRLLPIEQLSETPALILRECIERLDEFGVERMDYVFLVLHTATVALNQKHPQAFSRVFR